ncbi:Uncharacterised protein [Vibrio cholerae]|uniref:Uncharacterized protein n=1 Tax=Vibrio cholerae TaxID=666 RepID=A0A655U831_VIBCL|nr:Uncharacterised protein [Vibrio cholerae]CRZ96965.1 Uncharacterised protein [Vibrio cholerae]CRZ98838.1 Uncharacterised protein [Vibrio cholerae]CSA99589.1 Uncharacterised protein [Vibrio cholerae]CSB19177.1 Uncharacterised protein [Vibrio cholerae]
MLVACDQSAIWEYHIHFISTVSNSGFRFSNGDFNIVITVRKIGYRSNTDFRGSLLAKCLLSNRNKARVNTNGSRVADWTFRIMTKLDHFGIRIVVIQRGEIHQFQCT